MYTNTGFADAEQKQRLESGDAPLLPTQKEADDGDDNNAAIRERFDEEEKNVDEDSARCQFSSKASSSEALPAFATMNPNIAELSQLTALRMMQNFEDFHARFDDMVSRGCSFFSLVNNFLFIHGINIVSKHTRCIIIILLIYWC